MAISDTTKWARILDVIAGIIAILMSIYLISNPGVALLTISIYFAISLILISVAMLSWAIAAISGWSKALMIIFACLVFILALVTIFSPLLGDLIIVSLYAGSLLLIGIGSIIGAKSRPIPSWLKSASISQGIIAILISAVILFFPQLGLVTLVLLLGINLFLFGVKHIMLGLL